MPTESPPLNTSSTNLQRARSAAHTRPLDGLLRCVSSGYMSDGCSCQATIPAGVVTAAWVRELELLGAHEDRFFRFAWRGGVWFAFGLHDGSVRGVYCPRHSAARAERSFVQHAGVAY
jgi:hypothetical protein